MCTNAFLQNVRNLTTTAGAFAKNHYDALGVTPRATQAQVKSAYYKLSLRYHPDKNDGSEEASRNFRDISSAYEVLGNVRLRRLYDKGLSGPQNVSVNVDEDPNLRFYRSRERMTRPPMPDGRTPIYDFDEWSKQHYGATFARDMRRKQRRQMEEVIFEKYKNEGKVERVLLIMFLALLLGSLMTVERDHDKVVVKNEEKMNPRT